MKLIVFPQQTDPDYFQQCLSNSISNRGARVCFNYFVHGHVSESADVYTVFMQYHVHAYVLRILNKKWV